LFLSPHTPFILTPYIPSYTLYSCFRALTHPLFQHPIFLHKCTGRKNRVYRVECVFIHPIFKALTHPLFQHPIFLHKCTGRKNRVYRVECVFIHPIFKALTHSLFLHPIFFQKRTRRINRVHKRVYLIHPIFLLQSPHTPFISTPYIPSKLHEAYKNGLTRSSPCSPSVSDLQKSPIFSHKSLVFLQKSPVFPQESPIFPQKSPTLLQAYLEVIGRILANLNVCI